LFLVIIILLHFLYPDYNPLAQFISEYGYGRLGWLASIAFILQGIGFLFLGLNLLKLEESYRSKVGLGLIFFLFVANIIFGLFPMEPAIPPTTFGGTLHYWVGFVHVILGALTPLITLFKLKNAPVIKDSATVLWVLAIIASVDMVIGFLVMNAGLAGLTRRIFVLCLTLWSMYVTVELGKET
jgi:hypothetical protein